MVQPIIMCITLTVSTVFSDFSLFMLKLNTRLLSWIFSSSPSILTTKFYFKLIRKIFWPNFILRLLIFRYFTCTEHFIPTLYFFSKNLVQADFQDGGGIDFSPIMHRFLNSTQKRSPLSIAVSRGNIMFLFGKDFRMKGKSSDIIQCLEGYSWYPGFNQNTARDLGIHIISLTGYRI